MKVILSEKQLALMEEIGLPFDIEKEYDISSLGDLEECVSDYALEYEYDENGMTDKGEDLIDLVNLFAVLSYKVPNDGANL